jgi:uncharacterized membrane protein
MKRVEKSITVNVPASEAYAFWRNLENFPLFMKNVKEVRAGGDGTYHWIIEGPMGRRLEYDAELTQDQPGRAIGWNSTGGDMQTTGEVTFQDIDQGCKVLVVLNYYDVPAGPLGEAIAQFLSDPEGRLEEDLRNFKHHVEAGAPRR